MKQAIASLMTAAALLGAAPAGATILTFDVSGGVIDHGDIPQTYGDRVVISPDGLGHNYVFGAEGGTPNVVVDYGGPGEDPALWTTGYGDLVNVHFNDRDASGPFTIVFDADSGFLVDLFGFDLAAFANNLSIQGLKVLDLDSNTVLFSQGLTAIPDGPHYDLDFATPLSANRLGLVIDLQLGGVSDDIGIDNIRFGQRLAPVVGGAVPEPSTWAMMLVGFGLIGAAMRRRVRTTVAFV